MVGGLEMTPRATALAVVQRVAESRGLQPERLFDRTREPAIDAARTAAYRALMGELNMSQGRIARLFGRTQPAISIALKRPEPDSDPHERIEDLERMLRRLSGCELSHVVTARLGLVPWMSILASILIEAYPRIVSVEAMSELYDEASRRMGHGKQAGVVDAQVRAFISRARAQITGQGLPEPFKAIRPQGYALTEEFALWCSHNIGRPFIASVAAQKLAA